MFRPLISALALAGAQLILSTAATAESTINASTPEWKAYIETSQTLRALDQAAMASELKKVGAKKATKPEHTKDFGFNDDEPVAFYKTLEGQRIANIVLSFQTPSGGWSKRTDMSLEPRKVGQAWGVENSYQPTFDNYATSTHMRLLGKAYAAKANQDYSASFLRGLHLILAAQMPNGGWPQSFPLDGGYHDLLTFNDKSMVNILELLREITRGDYAFVSAKDKAAAQAAIDRGIECFIASQVKIAGVLTIWGAQHNPMNLQSAAARAYEPASLASQESAEILAFLMQQPEPSEKLQQTIQAAMAWFKATQINGKRYDRNLGALVDDAKAKPTWSRFYSLDDNKPLFGDRDGKVYRQVTEISLERRQGYAWYGTGPAKLDKQYKQWQKKWMGNQESSAPNKK